MIWHNNTEYPVDILKQDFDIEIEMITGKEVKARTCGYGFSTYYSNGDLDECSSLGWIWIKRWKFIEKEYEVK